MEKVEHLKNGAECIYTDPKGKEHPVVITGVQLRSTRMGLEVCYDVFDLNSRQLKRVGGESLTPLAKDRAFIVFDNLSYKVAEGISSILNSVCNNKFKPAPPEPPKDRVLKEGEMPPIPKAAKKQPVDTVVQDVRKDLKRRFRIGIDKYGTTLDREDLSLKEWLQHAYEECLDKALYLKRAIRELDKTQDR